MLWLIVSLFTTVFAAIAAVPNVTVLGVTNVQVLLSFEVPANTGCSVRISEDRDFSNLVNDVNPNLFPGSDLDSREGSVVEGDHRIFIAGRRAVERGSDGKWHSRALQTNTVHYYRVICGDQTGQGTFRTANLPVGTTYPWPIPQDPETGQFRWPSVDNNDRNQVVIDPNYGTLIRRVSLPGDFPSDNNAELRRKSFSRATGTNWNNPENALRDDGAAAIYSGSGQEWLRLIDPQISLTQFYRLSFGIDYITVRVTGSGEGSPEERSIDVCLTVDGSTCSGEIRSAELNTSEKTITLGTEKPIDTWGETLYPDAVGKNPEFGIMIRRSSQSGGTINIGHVEADVVLSENASTPDGGFMQTCAPVKSNGGYRCSFMGANGNLMYWIHPDTGEVRRLGTIVVTNWNGRDLGCRSGPAMFDWQNPDIYYCAATQEGKTVLLKGTYKGNDQEIEPGEYVPMTWENLTPAPDTIAELIRKFNPEFDLERYACSLATLAGDHAIFVCRRGNQDSIGWLAAFDLRAGERGAIIAAARSYQCPTTRWCGIHSVQPVGANDWIAWSPNPLLGKGGDGSGPHNVELRSEIPAGPGKYTIQVSGEPEPYLMDAAVGDTFRVTAVDGYDLLTIIAKNSSTEWVVERKVSGGAPGARKPGAILTAFCGAQNLDQPDESPTAYWAFREDPAGRTKMIAEKQLTGGHMVERGDHRVMAHYQGYAVVTPGVPASFNVKPRYRIITNPKWDGKRASSTLMEADGLGNTYSQHPSYENYKAAGRGRNNWIVDLVVFTGNRDAVKSLSKVSGTSQVYKVEGNPLQRDRFPTFATCGGRQLKEIPGPITDQKVHSFCVGSNCTPGATASDVFVNCPAPATVASRCPENFWGDDSSVCVADLAPYGQTVTQFYLDSSGVRNRVLTNGLLAWNSPRTFMGLDTATALPDGSWVIFPSYANNGRKDLYMVKVPDQPEFRLDSEKGALGQAPIEITAPQGTSQVKVKFGPKLESSITVNCRAGQCAVPVPGKPLDVLLIRPEFYDGNGHQVGQGRTGAHVNQGVEGSGISKPKISQRGVLNAASYEPKLAPGSIAVIVGEELSNCTSPSPLTTRLCDTSVLFNGRQVLIYNVDPVQINVFTPSEIMPGEDLEVVVEREGQLSDPVRLPAEAVGEVAPAIFSYGLDGKERAVIHQPDGTMNGPDRPELSYRPLQPGETGIIFANALGPTNPSVPDGDPAPGDPLARTIFPVDVYVNDVRQPVQFASLVPGSAGLYQVSFVLEPSTPIKPGDENRVWLSVNGVDSPRVAISLSSG